MTTPKSRFVSAIFVCLLLVSSDRLPAERVYGGVTMREHSE
jgi:hypothetical protein